MSWRFALWVTLGGSIGSLLRFWIGTRLPFQPSEFAWATFLVNMAGCFAIGCCYPWISDDGIRAFFVVGILGGFTTFSGFGLEIFRYVEFSAHRMAIIYGSLSLILGTILVWLGFKIGLWLK